MHKRGGMGWEPESAKIRYATDSQRSAQNASVRCNVSQKITKDMCGHPRDHVRLRRRLLTALACNLTLPNLHLATFKCHDAYYLVCGLAVTV